MGPDDFIDYLKDLVGNGLGTVSDDGTTITVDSADALLTALEEGVGENV